MIVSRHRMSNRSRGVVGRGLLAAAAAVVLTLAVAPAARAHIDEDRLGGMVQLDSATAVSRGMSRLSWRTANPLAVPDVFGPGSVLSVGNVRMKVTNEGILGNPFTTSSDPSAQWPGSSGVEYLSGIYLAVGAVNPTATDPTALRRVSYSTEWRPPTLDPEDKIYKAFDGIINGERFVNDDGDTYVDSYGERHPKVDEDFLDGHDNDGDGLIDEDHAALGQQEFSFVMRDDTREAVNTVFREKHVPLGLQCNTRAWAYSIQGYQDFNVIEYDITNISGHELDSLTIGWLVDIDSGPIQLGSFWTDDIDFPFYPQGEFVFKVGATPGDLPDPNRLQLPHAPSSQLDNEVPPDTALCPRFPIRVNAFSIGDQDGDLGKTPGLGTFMLIDHTTDPTGINGPKRVGFRAYRSFAQSTAFAQGGLPRVDQERFQSMESQEGMDVNPTSPTYGFINAPQGNAKGDYAAWCSIGPWIRVAAGQTITATVAFGVRNGTTALANAYPADYLRYKAGVQGFSGADLIAKYPALSNAITAQVAFEGINEDRSGFLETNPPGRGDGFGGRDMHGRETALRMPRGSPPQDVTEDCTSVGRPEARKVRVTDQEYSWFDFDCDYCTGVWDVTKQRGLFHKTWNAAAPPPNPNTNVASTYNFTDNPGRTAVPAGDRSVQLAWDNISLTTPDPKSRWLDFRGFDIWKVSDWTRPVGTAGPNESDWRLLGEFRDFDYFTSNDPSVAVPYEHNYTVDDQGHKNCPMVFVPNYFDPATHVYGKTIPVCLDKEDLFNHQSGEIIKPDWTTPCNTDTAGARIPLEINTGDFFGDGTAAHAGSVTHVFKTAGTYKYFDLHYPNYVPPNQVVVQANGLDSATVTIVQPDSSAFSPSSVTIKPGGYVRWINQSPSNRALQSDRHCQLEQGEIVHRRETQIPNPKNQKLVVKFPVGRYKYVDHEVKNGFLYFYSITAFDSTTDNSVTTELGGRRSAVESEGVVPEARVDAHGKHGVWVVPNPYRGYSQVAQRPSSWDLTPNATDPTGTHIDFMGLPAGQWTIRIYTVSGDLVQTIHSTDAVNESVRQPVQMPNGQTLPGYNRQQDNPTDGQARWNLISRNGQDIVSGIYLFTVDSSEGSQRGKFIVIR